MIPRPRDVIALNLLGRGRPKCVALVNLAACSESFSCSTMRPLPFKPLDSSGVCSACAARSHLEALGACVMLSHPSLNAWDLTLGEADMVAVFPGPDEVLLSNTLRSFQAHRRLLVSVHARPELSDFSLGLADPASDLAEDASLVGAPSCLSDLSDSDMDEDRSSLASAATAMSSPSVNLLLPSELSQNLQPPPRRRYLSDGATIPPAPKGTAASLTLIGAGPGAPSLLTIAAVTALRNSTLIIADRLVPSAILALIPASTPVLTARKLPGRAQAAQDEIHIWILAALDAGHRVARLKGGDPFLFARGAEELLHVRARRPRCPARVIPGLSSALAAPLLAGIPVTHRGVADQLLIATGTTRDGRTPATLPPHHPTRTLALLMAVSGCARLVDALLAPAMGYPADLPVVVVERAGWGSCKAGEGQRVLRCVLADVPTRVVEAGITHHATMIIGRVGEVLQGLGCGVAEEDAGILEIAGLSAGQESLVEGEEV